MTTYTRKPPKIPGFYLVQFEHEGKTVTAMLIHMGYTEGVTVDGKTPFNLEGHLIDLDDPHKYWLCSTYKGMRWSERITG